MNPRYWASWCLHEMELTHGSLFSGIGGFDLGFERVGFKSLWQVEIDDYATKVLEKNFPNAQRFRDIRTVGKRELAVPTVLTGGFPCQDISIAGKGEGLAGSRSGLWSEYYRIICELRPRFVVVENVAEMYRRGLCRVLGDLASCGYDAEWDCIPAATFGAPHLRERIWIVAYPVGAGGIRGRLLAQQAQKRGPSNPFAGRDSWLPEPAVCELDDGLPAGLVRYAGRGTRGIRIPNRRAKLHCLGNAIVPQIAEFIAWQIRFFLENET